MRSRGTSATAPCHASATGEPSSNKGLNTRGSKCAALLPGNRQASDSAGGGGGTYSSFVVSRSTPRMEAQYPIKASGGGAAGRAYRREKSRQCPRAYVVTHHSRVWSHSPSAQATTSSSLATTVSASDSSSFGGTEEKVLWAQTPDAWGGLALPARGHSSAKCLTSWAWTHWGFVHLCPWGHCWTHHRGSRLSRVVLALPHPI